MKKSLCAFAVVGLLFTSGAVIAVPTHDPEPYGYHLRIVRVSGAIGNPGAAVGWTDNGGIPVMLPSEEAWGDPVQLEALAKTLGGERADAITGFFLTADASGAKFDRRVYLEDSVIDLSFDAVPPGPGSDEHQLTVELDAPELENPLAEARLLARTNRTIAIAAPSPVKDDWLVLAVTLVDQGTIDDLRATKEHIKSPDDAGVTKPKVIHKPQPRYPEAARKNQIQGHVIVLAMIDQQGVPHAPMVMDMSPGAEELAAAAVDAVTAWRFEPATLDGKPVDVYTTITVQFNLQ
jgi:TonB family protein